MELGKFAFPPNPIRAMAREKIAATANIAHFPRWRRNVGRGAQGGCVQEQEPSGLGPSSQAPGPSWPSTFPAQNFSFFAGVFVQYYLSCLKWEQSAIPWQAPPTEGPLGHGLPKPLRVHSGMEG